MKNIVIASIFLFFNLNVASNREQSAALILHGIQLTYKQPVNAAQKLIEDARFRGKSVREEFSRRFPDCRHVLSCNKQQLKALKSAGSTMSCPLCFASY